MVQVSPPTVVTASTFSCEQTLGKPIAPPLKVQDILPATS